MSELVVKELTPSLRNDFLLFFDHVAFADNSDWSDRYCSAYHFTNKKGKAEARREASSLIEKDRMHGFLPVTITEDSLAGVMRRLAVATMGSSG